MNGEHYPLGTPIRPEPKSEPEWKDIPGKPHFQVNKVGQMRCIRPPPMPSPMPEWFFVDVTKA